MTNKGTVQAVFVDMDGTLLDTERVNCECLVEVLQKYGLAAAEAVEIVDAMIGLSGPVCDRMLIERYGSDFPLDRYTSDFVVQRRNRLASGIPIKPGAQGMLSMTQSEGLVTAIVTSTKRAAAKEHLDRTDLLRQVNLLVAGDDVARGKPDPEPYLAAAMHLGIPTSNCVVIEDSGPGIEAAWAAGMTPILVPDLIQPTEEVRARCAEVADDLFDAGQLIQAMLRE